MSKNLKQVMGLGERRAKTSSGAPCQQKQEFEKAFKAEVKKVNEHLAYTSAHAEETKHKELADKRDKVCSAYQSVSKKINPNRPKAAEEAIDRVTASVEKLAGDAKALREYAEKHHKAWTDNEEKLDDAAEQSAEMVEWGYAGGEKYDEVVKAIREQVKLRKFKEALEALTKLLEKLQPAHDDYVVQSDAKVAYEQMIEDNRLTLEDFSAADVPALSERKTEIDANFGLIRESVESLDYADALFRLEPELLEVEAFLEEHAYEAALVVFQPRIDKLQAELDSTSLDGLGNAAVFGLAEASMKKAAMDGDHVLALRELRKLEPEVDAQLNEIARIEFSAEITANEQLVRDANAITYHGNEPLQERRRQYQAQSDSIIDLAIAKKWEEALSASRDSAATAQEYIDEEQAFRDLDASLGANNADYQWVGAFYQGTPPHPDWNEEILLIRTYNEHFNAGDYRGALADWRLLLPKIASLKTRVAANNAIAGPKAQAAAEKIRKLAGVKDLKKLGKNGMNRLIKSLKKLPEEEQRQLWKDLRMPSAELGDEQKKMQAALFAALEIDKEFEQAEQELRKAYEEKLYNDPELERAIQDWDMYDEQGDPLVDEATKKEMIQRAITVQSEVYGIDVPEINWDPEWDRGVAVFQSNMNQIVINPDTLNSGEIDRFGSEGSPEWVPGVESLALMLHENAHNFQDELVKKYLRGELSKEDPMYEQAELFAFNGAEGYLSPFDNDPHTSGISSKYYYVQPMENHSYDVQESARDTLIHRHTPV